MTKDEALKMAIDLTERFLDFDGISSSDYIDVRDACKEALEQPTQEPVAWMHRHDGEITEFNDFQSCKKCEPLYTHPHQWQGLTDDEIGEMYDKAWIKYKGDTINVRLDKEFARAIEQALRSKNDS